MKALIYRAAAQRLGEIWDYTVEKWGEEQADTYLRQLGACIDRLPAARDQWRGVKDKRLPGVHFVRHGHHFIFFREIGEQLAIISILHEGMDLPARLREDATETP